MQKNFKYLDILGMVFVAILIISNIAATKTLSICGLTFDGGTLIFPISYIFDDIFTEVYGYDRTRRIVWTGLCMITFMSIVFCIVGKLPSDPHWNNQAAYDSILGQTPRIVLASLTGCFFGEFSNSFVMAKMKIRTHGKKLWSRILGSTVVGELFDTAIFVSIAFYGVIPNSVLGAMFLSNYVFKVAYEIIAMPGTYRLVRFLKKKEGVDYFDTGTNFSPFAVKI